MAIWHWVYISAPIDVVWTETLDLESWVLAPPTGRSIRRLDGGPLRVGSSV